MSLASPFPRTVQGGGAWLEDVKEHRHLSKIKLPLVFLGFSNFSVQKSGLESS